MLAMPSASSSESGSWRVPAMPSAITADSSDSIRQHGDREGARQQGLQGREA